MKKTKITFALYFGNRGFFPSTYLRSARAEMIQAVTEAGYGYICMEEEKSRHGAIETIAEGQCYARFLAENRGKYNGVIVCLPNFGDENGALAALREAGVPLLIQAYPDEIGKMDFDHRRDAMCGKFAICNVLRQAKIPFTQTNSFVCTPDSATFQADLHTFAAVCRIVEGMKAFNVGAIGARTTAFKTVRVDEIALQNARINLEAFDLSDIFAAMARVSQAQIEKKKKEILAITVFEGYPTEKLDKIAALQVVLEDIAAQYDLQAMAVRCWSEFQTVQGIAPCTNLCLLNAKGIAAACEVDISNALMMRALTLASDDASTLLDFNNNYGTEPDKAIMFHCGPVPPSMLHGKGKMTEHLMFKKSYGAGSGVGVNRGEILSGDITFGSIKVENGKISAFAAEGVFTDDVIEEGFFGTGKVVQKENINELEKYMAANGYKHHVCVSFGRYKDALYEAFTNYLGYETERL